jgi:hypothetical protein
MPTNTVLILLNILAILGTIIWLAVKPEWEPIVTLLGLIGALIAQIGFKSKNDRNLKMNQRGGDNSNNYQSGRDINIGK